MSLTADGTFTNVVSSRQTGSCTINDTAVCDTNTSIGCSIIIVIHIANEVICDINISAFGSSNGTAFK